MRRLSHSSVRLLLVADTHLGFDLPFRPRVERRRRGHDFFANFRQALRPALRDEVDLVVHGGDLFYRSRVPAALVEMAMAPLIEVAQAGVPVFIVPGNHERSRIPLHLWAAHPNIHIFDQPVTFSVSVGGIAIALSGFPFDRYARETFRTMAEQTGYREVWAGIHLLCFHGTVEGAQVGPSDYTFRHGVDVVRGRDIPPGFAAVLAGHIHRSQMLSHDLSGRPLAAPVIYPGAVERTSFAERNEGKHYVIVEVAPSTDGCGQLVRHSFFPLPARPMADVVIRLAGLSAEALRSELHQKLSELDPQAVVRIQVRGPWTAEATQVLAAHSLRALAPPEMNVSLSLPDMARG